MNPTFSIVPTTRTFTDTGPNLYSDYMLCELMAAQDELITRLRIEQAGASGEAAGFLSRMISQHENDAAKLLALFESHPGHAA